MPRDLPLGNGDFLVTFDSASLLGLDALQLLKSPDFQSFNKGTIVSALQIVQPFFAPKAGASTRI